MYHQVIKKLHKGVKRSSGRNNLGRICSRHRGSGHKRKFKFISYQFSPFSKLLIVKDNVYNANSNFPVLLLRDLTSGKYAFVTQFNNYKLGGIVSNYSENNSFNEGSQYTLKSLPLGSYIYNLENKPYQGARFIKSSGTFGKLIKKKDGLVTILMPSGKLKYVSEKCSAFYGSVFNTPKQSLKKAGQSRWLGIRPRVRGVAINPVDHPHGGGEGKGRIGRIPVSPWGKLTLGFKTL